MSAQTSRNEVGTTDLGLVVVLGFTSADGDTFQVRAGGHTIGTYDTEAQAESVARVLVGDQALRNEFVAGPEEVEAVGEPEPEAKPEPRARDFGRKR